jgi:hypothetical protein
MLIRPGSSGWWLKTAEPHAPQNHFSQPPSGLQARRLSSPEISRNEPGSGRALAEAAVPLRRWQRVAVAVVRRDERRGHLEADGSTAATAGQRKIGRCHLDADDSAGA